jgi:hypothetical protein
MINEVHCFIAGTNFADELQTLLFVSYRNVSRVNELRKQRRLEGKMWPCQSRCL